MIRQSGSERKIRARIKRRIDVDQVHLAGEVGQERGQDVLLVAPDEAVAPLRVVSRRGEFQRALALLHALVDGLDGLKGQLDANRSALVAVLVVLAVPDEFRPFLKWGRNRE